MENKDRHVAQEAYVFREKIYTTKQGNRYRYVNGNMEMLPDLETIEPMSAYDMKKELNINYMDTINGIAAKNEMTIEEFLIDQNRKLQQVLSKDNV